MEISNNKITPQDIINLCLIFYEIPIKSSFTPDDLCLLIRECVNNQEHFIAYQISKLLTTLNPKDPNHHTRLGWVLSGWNLMDQAEAAYLVAVELEPDNPDFRDFYGRILEINNKHKLALSEFIRASDLDPSNTDYPMRCAVVCDKMKDLSNARNYMIKVIVLAPNDADYKHQYGLLLQQNKFYTEAL